MIAWALNKFGGPLVAKVAIIGIGVMAGLLLASLFANYLLLGSRDAALKRASVAETRLSQATAAAKACSDGVAKVRQEEAARRLKVEAAAKAAESRARSAEQRAQATMQARPTVPGDACASALALSRQKLQERRKARGAP